MRADQAAASIAMACAMTFHAAPVVAHTFECPESIFSISEEVADPALKRALETSYAAVKSGRLDVARSVLEDATAAATTMEVVKIYPQMSWLRLRTGDPAGSHLLLEVANLGLDLSLKSMACRPSEDGASLINVFAARRFSAGAIEYAQTRLCPLVIRDGAAPSVKAYDNRFFRKLGFLEFPRPTSPARCDAAHKSGVEDQNHAKP